MDSQTVRAYLRRIDATWSAELTPATLADLHVRHLRAVPFENLSIHLGEPISLDEASLVDKIVRRRRGGFCYELNGAFAALLRALGFDVTLLAALVHVGDGRFSTPLDHLALRVDLDGHGSYLVDVGFGAHTDHPLRLGTTEPQTDPAGTFLVRDTATGDVEILRDGEVSYRVEEHPRRIEDFVPTCWYHQTSPDSHFTSGPTCSLRTENGRVTLRGDRLITTVGDDRTETALRSDDEILAAYRDHFGVRLDRVPTRAAPAPA